MKTLAFGTLTLLVIFSACNKNADPKPTVSEQTSTAVVTPIVTPVETIPTAKGGISGSIYPAVSVESIEAYSTKFKKSYQLPIDQSTGKFGSTDIPEGEYVLNFKVTRYYQSPESKNMVVNGDKNIEAGEFILKRLGYPLSCYVNGAYEGWSLTAYYNNKFLQLANYGGGTPSNSLNTEIRSNLSILLPDFNGPGTYVCNETSGSKISYNLSKSITISSQTTQTPGGSGTVIITSVDPVARRIKGTFTATIPARSSSSGDARTFTDGIIDVAY